MLYIIILLILVSIAYAGISLAPWVPTASGDLVHVNKIARLTVGQIFLEMGCGDGKVCSYVAKNNPDALVEGIELAFPLYFLAKLKTALSGPNNLKILFGDALKYDISKADVIYVFGRIASMNSKVKEKILCEMKADSKLISYAFPINDWQGEKTEYKETANSVSIYVYKKS